MNVEHQIAINALEIIAGEKQCIDNLMSHADIAREALKMIRERPEQPSTPTQPGE